MKTKARLEASLAFQRALPEVVIVGSVEGVAVRKFPTRYAKGFHPSEDEGRMVCSVCGRSGTLVEGYCSEHLEE